MIASYVINNIYNCVVDMIPSKLKLNSKWRTVYHEAGHVIIAKNAKIKIYYVRVSSSREEGPRGIVEVESINPPCFNNVLIRDHIRFFVAGEAADLFTTRKRDKSIYRTDRNHAIEYCFGYLYANGYKNPTIAQANYLLFLERKKAIEFLYKNKRRWKQYAMLIHRFKKPTKRLKYL